MVARGHGDSRNIAYAFALQMDRSCFGRTLPSDGSVACLAAWLGAPSVGRTRWGPRITFSIVAADGERPDSPQPNGYPSLGSGRLARRLAIGIGAASSLEPAPRFPLYLGSRFDDRGSGGGSEGYGDSCRVPFGSGPVDPPGIGLGGAS